MGAHVSSMGVRGLHVWPLFVIPPHGQPHTVFGALMSICGGWMLSCEKLYHGRRLSPYNILIYLGVLAGVNAL